MKCSLSWPNTRRVDVDDDASRSRLSLMDEDPRLKASLTFRLKWDKVQRILHIHLLQASNLSVRRSIVDSYVRLDLFFEENLRQSQ